MSKLLLDPVSREILANWLKDKERPHQVPEHIYNSLLTARTASIDFAVMGELVDCFGPRIFDLLMIPGYDRNQEQELAERRRTSRT